MLRKAGASGSNKLQRAHDKHLLANARSQLTARLHSENHKERERDPTSAPLKLPLKPVAASASPIKQAHASRLNTQLARRSTGLQRAFASAKLCARTKRLSETRLARELNKAAAAASGRQPLIGARSSSSSSRCAGLRRFFPHNSECMCASICCMFSRAQATKQTCKHTLLPAPPPPPRDCLQFAGLALKSASSRCNCGRSRSHSHSRNRRTERPTTGVNRCAFLASIRDLSQRASAHQTSCRRLSKLA